MRPPHAHPQVGPACSCAGIRREARLAAIVSSAGGSGELVSLLLRVRELWGKNPTGLSGSAALCKGLLCRRENGPLFHITVSTFCSKQREGYSLERQEPAWLWLEGLLFLCEMETCLSFPLCLWAPALTSD